MTDWIKFFASLARPECCADFNGRKCRCIALSGSDLCAHHHAQRSAAK